MPRIPHSLLLQAYNISSLLPLTLRATRDIQSAKNELRWLTEHVQESAKGQSSPEFNQQRRSLLKLCRRRERGEPLQYILGSQPFGDLDIKCRPGVLIPRPETEAYTSHLASLLLDRGVPGIDYTQHEKSLTDSGPSARKPLRVLDICSGSGCISLLLFSRLRSRFQVQVTGWDVSKVAVDLANENKKAHFKDAAARDVRYEQLDIFKPVPPGKYDIVVSNPPYIHEKGLKDVSRSVQNWEPRLALIPPGATDWGSQHIFYRRIIELERDCFGSKILVMEVSGSSQATDVIKMAIAILGQRRIEIWRDEPGPHHMVRKFDISNRQPAGTGPDDIMLIDVWGRGRIRTVVIYGADATLER